MAYLLAMTKPLSGICHIVVGEICINTQAMIYAFDFVMFLQHIFLTPIWNYNQGWM
jgi:hypothetical protein